LTSLYFITLTNIVNSSIIDIVTIIVNVIETGQEKEMHTLVKKARALGEITAGLAKSLIKEK